MKLIKDEIQNADFLERLRANERAAQAQFWENCFDAVYRCCVRFFGEGLDANEMAVEVLMEFLSRYVHHLTRPEAMLAYLRMMAIRRCSHEKKRRRIPQAADMDGFEAANEGTDDESLTLRAMRPQLEKCLQILSPKAQRVLMLRHFGDLTNEKIGGLLGGSKQYIGRLLRRSHERLRDCLERGGSAP